MAERKTGYEPPASNARQDGKLLVVPVADARLPERCVKCNESTRERVTKSYSWHPGILYVGILMGLIPYVILALIFSKSAKVELGVCKKCNSRSTVWFGIGGLMLFGGIAAFFGGIIFGTSGPPGPTQDAWLFGIFAGLPVAFVGMAMMGATNRVLVAKNIDDRYAHLAHANREYLEMLPPWTGV